jgi:hypothetical protein
LSPDELRVKAHTQLEPPRPFAPAWVQNARVLVFVHLSDIHFSSRKAGDPWELDETVRRELRHDVVAQASSFGGISGLLITGDIAHAGQPAQYAKAEDWLAELCRELQIGTENVWVIPGNHDVDWSAHSPEHDGLRAELESIELLKLDERLEGILTDATAASMFLAPLGPYTDFARRYDSNPDPNVPCWTRDFELDADFVLRVRGLNSVLISDTHDEASKPRLVIGSVQTQLMREAGVVHVALCHHPADWLRDGDSMHQVHTNATVLLTGHEHHAEVRQVEQCVWISAGALHPERDREGWRPHYNLVTLKLIREHESEDSPEARVEIDIYPRVWKDNRFVAALSGSGRERHSVDLDEVAVAGIYRIGDSDARYEPQPEGAAVANLADRRVRLLHRYGELLEGARQVIAHAMGLSLGEIKDSAQTKLAEQVIRRAEEQGRLADLWDLVEAGHNQSAGDNPYRIGNDHD